MAKHKVTFLPQDVTVEVDDEKYPLADHGRRIPERFIRDETRGNADVDEQIVQQVQRASVNRRSADDLVTGLRVRQEDRRNRPHS